MFPILVTGWGKSNRQNRYQVPLPELPFPLRLSLSGCNKIPWALISHSSGGWQKELRVSLGVSFIKDTTSILEGGADHLPKAPPPFTIVLGIRFQHLNFAGDTSIPSLTPIFLENPSRAFCPQAHSSPLPRSLLHHRLPLSSARPKLCLLPFVVPGAKHVLGE